MNNVQKNGLKQKIRHLLEKEINVTSELVWCEIAEDIMDDVLDSIVMRLSELRSELDEETARGV